MRLFSILAALVVALVLYMAVFERPTLMGMFSSAEQPEGAEQAAPTETLTAETAAGAKAAQDAKRVRVSVMQSTASQVDSAVVIRGQTAAARQVDVRAETTAIIASDPLRKGSQVDAGQALCVLDTGTRGAALDETRARLTEAKSRVPEAEARLSEAKARLEEAEINQNAAAKLIEDGFASQTRVVAADAAVAAAKAGVSSATAGLEGARSGIEAASAAVASAEKEITRLTISAPFAGLLETDTAELGSLLQAGGVCATVIQLDPIKLVGFVPETEVNHISLGAQAGARLAAGGQEVTGKVTFLSRSADPSTRTFRVEIEVPNADLKIRDGQTAEIAIASAGAQAHLIPQSALTLNDEGALGVRIVDENAVVSFAPLELIRDTPQGVWVTGLPETADVIVVGQEYVTEGVTVIPTYKEVSQ